MRSLALNNQGEFVYLEDINIKDSNNTITKKISESELDFIKRAILDPSIDKDFENLFDNVDAFEFLNILMDKSCRLELSKRSKDFETLILLAGDDGSEVASIAKERALALGFYDHRDRIDSIMKKHFK